MKLSLTTPWKNLNHVIFSNHELPLGEEYESHLSSQSDPRKQNLFKNHNVYKLL